MAAKVLNVNGCTILGVDYGTTLDINAGYPVTPGNSAWTATVDTDEVFFVNVVDVTDGEPDRGIIAGESTPLVVCGENVLVEIEAEDTEDDAALAGFVPGARIIFTAAGKYDVYTTGTLQILGEVVEQVGTTAVLQLRTGVCSAA